MKSIRGTPRRKEGKRVGEEREKGRVAGERQQLISWSWGSIRHHAKTCWSINVNNYHKCVRYNNYCTALKNVHVIIIT